MGHVFRRSAALAIAAMLLALTVSIASADGPGYKTVSDDFQNLLFGLNVGSGDELIVADSGAGPTRLDPGDGDTTLFASLPGVTDVIQVGRREYLALTGGGGPGGGDPTSAKLWRIKNGTVTQVADIKQWELDNDPDQSGNDPNEDAISNPFDLAKLSRNRILVADAGGNSILVIDKHGKIDWVATLPAQLLDGIPADAVPTSVEVGQDGAIYAGELTGFPATPGTSRVWRIERDARHVECQVDGGDDDCTLVNVGDCIDFDQDTPCGPSTGPRTSIIDIKFGEDGTAYVLELDEASWLAEGPQSLGGTVNACRANDGSDDDDGDDGITWSCEEIATGLPFPLAVAVDDESVYVTLATSETSVEVALLTGTDSDEGEGDEDDD